ncbi:MAG: J domain-containing protein [Vicinamibacterales bacterium]
MEYKDYYRTLSVSKTATAGDIKKAFRKLARKYHPDVNPSDPSAERRFKEVNEAHEVIGNPDTRQKYDELGANWKHYERAQAAGQNPFGGRGRSMSEEDIHQVFGGDPFSDFFQNFFGGDGRQSRPSPNRRAESAQNLEHELTITLEQAFLGVTQRLSIRDGGNSRSIDVRIPAGVSDGSRVRVAGKGARSGDHRKHQDLYLRIKLGPHALFTRKGRDLYLNRDVTLSTALLGGTIDVTTLSGETIQLKIPSTTQPGQVFRIKEHGMPSLQTRTRRGNLYVTADVQLPSKLNTKEKELAEQFAALLAKRSPTKQ